MTPFGRQTMTAGHLAAAALAEAPAPAEAPDKWAVLRDLTAARAAFAVTDRDIAVLAALLTFHPTQALLDDDRLIVFPSNAVLSDRAHGMAESTLRRHLAALVGAGLIVRRDSPNGKRYATRDRTGALDVVFGFDLRPLLVQAPRIAAAAEAAKDAAFALRRLRAAAVIRLRDASKLLEWAIGALGRPCEELAARAAALHRRLRRKMTAEDARGLGAEAAAFLHDVRAIIPADAEKTDGSAGEIERHYHNSDKEYYEYENNRDQQQDSGLGASADPSLSLSVVLKAVPDVSDYAPNGITGWRDLLCVANVVSPMLGISPHAWTAARQVMGDYTAAITVACILQRSGHIVRPGGYLRSLTRKAASTGFSPGPMVMALLRAESDRALRHGG